MSRRILILCGLLPALALPALPAVAQASDASMIHALTPYKTALTTDILALAALNSVPAKSQIASWTSKLQRAQSDLATVARVARGQSPSTASGRTLQSEMLSGLSDAYGAAGDGLAVMAAARAGNTSAASADVRNEQSEFTKALVPLSAAGRSLGLL